MTHNDLLDLHMAFALAGGVVGASKAFFKQRAEPLAEKIVNFIVGCVLAVSLSDLSLKTFDLSVYGYLGVGLIWGLIGMYLVEALQNLAPAVTTRLIKEKLKKWLGIDLDDK